MTLKKINAILSLLSIILLAAHLGTCIYSYLTLVFMPGPIKILARISSVFIIAHVVISIIILFTQADGFKRDRYPGLNKRTNIQRISGIVILLMLSMHFKAYRIVTKLSAAGSPAVRPIMLAQSVFFAAVILHIAVSVSKAFISLGIITTEQQKNKVDRIVYIISAIVFVIAEFAVIRGWSQLFLV